MKHSRQFWVLVCFGILSAIPFIPVGLSFYKLRSTLVLDQPIVWAAGTEEKFQVPPLKAGIYELRLESTVSDWQPTVNLSWGLFEKQNSREIISIPTPQETVLSRPVAKIHIKTDALGENELSVKFANNNPAKHLVRIKLGHDRASLLESSSKQFGIVLAISLVLSLFLWKPLMKPVRPDAPSPNS